MHQPEQPSTCDLDVRVRYAEVDQMGVVHHSRYLEYFEMGRTELLRQGGVSYRQWEERGILLVVVRAVQVILVRLDRPVVERQTCWRAAAS